MLLKLLFRAAVGHFRKILYQMFRFKPWRPQSVVSILCLLSLPDTSLVDGRWLQKSLKAPLKPKRLIQDFTEMTTDRLKQ